MARRAPGRTAAAIPDLRRLEHGRASCRQFRPIGRLRGIGRRQRYRGTREPEVERLRPTPRRRCLVGGGGLVGGVGERRGCLLLFRKRGWRGGIAAGSRNSVTCCWV